MTRSLPTRMRVLAKTAAASALSWTPLRPFARFDGRRGRPFFIACYHRVVEQLSGPDAFPLPALEITVAMLARHLDWLGRHFRIASLDELAIMLEDGGPSVPVAAVTFDDGYSGTYHHAFPLLNRKGIPAAAFVVTDLVGTGQPLVHDRLHAALRAAPVRWTSSHDGVTELLRLAGVRPPSGGSVPRRLQHPFKATRFLLERLPHADVERLLRAVEADAHDGGGWKTAVGPLSWEQIREMHAAGMIIGSHSSTHAFLTNEDGSRLRAEAAGSRAELERKLGTEIRHFAYPGGHFNQPVVQAVAEAGYRCAFTICSHGDPRRPLLTVPRKVLGEQSCLDAFGRFSPALMRGHATGIFGREVCRHAPRARAAVRQNPEA